MLLHPLSFILSAQYYVSPIIMVITIILTIHILMNIIHFSFSSFVYSGFSSLSLFSQTGLLLLLLLLLLSSSSSPSSSPSSNINSHYQQLISTSSTSTTNITVFIASYWWHPEAHGGHRERPELRPGTPRVGAGGGGAQRGASPGSPGSPERLDGLFHGNPIEMDDN